MANLVALCCFSILLLSLASANQYTCQQCVAEGKNNCWGKKTVPNCDYCVKLQGTVLDVNKIPDAAKDYVKNTHPDFTIKNGQRVFGRGCITKQILQKFDMTYQYPDCVKIKPEDNVGFVGDACTCLGNC